MISITPEVKLLKSVTSTFPSQSYASPSACVLKHLSPAPSLPQAALPATSPLLNDASPKVRLAVAQLLLRIATCRGLAFYEVVPLPALLDSMAADACTAVRAKLFNLLAPSYLPNPSEGATRVSALLRNHPEAGAEFCRLASAAINQDGGEARKGALRLPLLT